MKPNYYTQQQPPQKQSNAAGTAGMIIGIISLVLSCILIGGFLGIVGLIISIIAVTQKGKKSTTAIVGIILNGIAIFILAFMLIVNSVASTDSGNDETDKKINNSAIENDENSSDEEMSSSQTDNSNDSNLTLGQKNALKKANSYLNTMAFSYNGLVEQLEYEGFTNAEATFAADNCDADWDEQALLKAKSYLDTLAFSYSGLIEQLEYEEFTTDQATYAADNCGADWNEQAALKAQSYLDIMAFSRDGLIEQLMYEGFTEDQSEYGATKVGY